MWSPVKIPCRCQSDEEAQPSGKACAHSTDCMVTFTEVNFREMSGSFVFKVVLLLLLRCKSSLYFLGTSPLSVL